MVFDKLGPSLFDFLRKNEYRPFPVDLVQDFARQLVQAVAYMHECKLVHTDLKPENILLVSLDYCQASSVGITGWVVGGLAGAQRLGAGRGCGSGISAGGLMLGWGSLLSCG